MYFLFDMCYNVPDESECQELLKRYGTPAEVVAHCEAVSRKSQEIADSICFNCKLDRELVRSAAMLHDIAKTKKDHADTGADFLAACGYPGIADVVRSHHCLKKEDLETVTEKSIVFYADKLIDGAVEVTLEERFAKSRLLCADPEALAVHSLQYDQAIKVRELIYYYLERC